MGGPEGIVSARTVTKRELCQHIAAATGCTQVATKAVVQQFLDEMVRELAQGNRIELRNFGVFGTRVQAPRWGRNPWTGAGVDVPEKAVVYFKVGKKMAAVARQAHDNTTSSKTGAGAE